MNKLLIGLACFVSCLTTFVVAVVEPPKVANVQPFAQPINNNISNMPIAADHPLAKFGNNSAPIEQRDESVRKYISGGVKILVSGFSGSGTIVYYDAKENLAYVQSCGHLWDGNMTASQGKTRKVTCQLQVWYHNQTKLSSPKTYNANVLYYNNGTGRDISLLTFTPDWVPDYFPIASENFEVAPNTRLVSTGCDRGTEIAAYDVRIVRLEEGQFPELITAENSPRPGRSGGGLLTKDGIHVGICVRTSDKSGNGIGLFTPLKTVRYFNKINGFEWLNEVGMNWARQLPIVDKNNKQSEYPKEYIPLPNR